MRTVALRRKNLIHRQPPGEIEGRGDSLGLRNCQAVEALAIGRGPTGTRRPADIQRLAHLTPAARVAQHSLTLNGCWREGGHQVQCDLRT
jgi:hypothetical protein